jgi:hypothetical protein
MPAPPRRPAPEKLDGYDHRDVIMIMAEELAQSLLPDDASLPPDAIHRLYLLHMEVSFALGIDPDEEGPEP